MSKLFLLLILAFSGVINAQEMCHFSIKSDNDKCDEKKCQKNCANAYSNANGACMQTSLSHWVCFCTFECVSPGPHPKFPPLASLTDSSSPSPAVVKRRPSAPPSKSPAVAPAARKWRLIRSPASSPSVPPAMSPLASAPVPNTAATPASSPKVSAPAPVPNIKATPASSPTVSPPAPVSTPMPLAPSTTLSHAANTPTDAPAPGPNSSAGLNPNGVSLFIVGVAWLWLLLWLF